MRFARSVNNALRGLKHAVATERHVQVQLGLAAAVLGLGLYTRVSPADWALLALAAGLVLSAELLNTALELLADALHPKRNPAVGLAKDVAAGAVLIAAAVAVLIGALVFLPHWS